MKINFRYAAGLFSIFFLFDLSAAVFSNTSNSIINGIYDVENDYFLQKKIVPLDGEWEFFWDKLLYTENYIPYNVFIKPDTYVLVPHFWKNTIYAFTGQSTSFGKASYRLTIKNLNPNLGYAIMIKESPGTASNIFVNGIKVFSTGIVSTEKSDSRPQAMPCYAEFFPSEYGTVELVIEVSNYVHRKGGLWDSVYFGEHNIVRSNYNIQSGSSHFVCALLLSLALVGFILFLLNHTKTDRIFFTLLILTCAARIAIAGFSILTLAIPTIEYGFQLKLEYLVIWLAPVAYLWQTISQFPQLKAPKKFLYYLTFATCAEGVVSIILPIQYANYLVVPFQVTAVFFFIIIFIILIRALISGDKQIAPYFLTFSIVGTGLISETLYTSFRGTISIRIIPAIVTIFSILQFMLLSKQQADLYHEQKKLSISLRHVNKTYNRFVPFKLFQILGHKNLTDLQTNCFKKQNAIVLYIQTVIQSFEKEQFDIFSYFIADSLSIIANHNGFISTCSGTGLTVIFSEPVDTVIKCCMEIQANTIQKNVLQKQKNKPTTALYMAIHYGDIILGLTGNESRVFGTAVSAAVETAHRMALYAQSVRRSIIISRQAAEEAIADDSFSRTLIPLGVITLKRNRQPVQMYECIPDKQETT